jgi:hypothetical protein
MFIRAWDPMLGRRVKGEQHVSQMTARQQIDRDRRDIMIATAFSDNCMQ